MQALHRPMQIRNCHEHARVTLAQKPFKPGTPVDERRIQQACQLDLVYSKLASKAFSACTRN